MSEAKHTTGPWIIQGNTVYALMHHGWRKGVELFKNRFSVQFSFDSSCSKEEIESTKQLIAVAHDLLADLQESAATLRRYETLHRAKGTAEGDEKAEVNARLASRFEATIAKATGGAA